MKKILLIILVISCFPISSLLSQDRTITGKVTSMEGDDPLPGVNIRLKGTTSGTVTDVNGEYSMSVPENGGVLIYSFIGFSSREVEIGDQSVINVSLVSDVTQLSEVVVTAIGIEREKKALGYSVENVEGERIQQVAEPDPIRALQGKVPGVNIIGSAGTPGSATRITVRGNSSFFGNNLPLVIVDGVPYNTDQYTTSNQLTSGAIYSNALSTLDPNNVESINVLKGAAAAALYGSRAANGVVVITTKTGAAKPSNKGLEVTVTSSYALEEIANLPEYQNTYGNGVEFQYANANGSWGPAFDSMDKFPTWQAYLDVFPDLPDSLPYVAQPDNVKNLFETGNVFETSVAIEGGNETSIISAVATRMQQNGYIPFSEFNRTNLSIGGRTNLANGLLISGNFNYTNSFQKGPLAGENLSSDPGSASSFARTFWLGRTWDTSFPFEDPVTGGPVFFVGNQADHPVWSWKYNGVTADVDRFFTNLQAGYDITEWLNVSYKIGINTYSDRRLQKYELGSRAYSGEGVLVSDDIYYQELESNLLLTFNTDINEDFSVRAILGQNINQRKTDRQSFFGRGIVTRGIDDLDNTKSVIPNGGDFEKRRLIGGYVDVSLGFRDYLFVNFGGRNDWSSTLPVDNQSYFYPYVNASYIFSDGLNITSDVLNFGKIRAGYARVGNDADPYQLVNIFRVNFGESSGLIGAIRDNDAPFLDQPTMTVNNISYDPNLTPEFTTEFEVGVNLGLLNNRIGVDFTYYNKISTDMIANISLPSASGFEQLITNFGELSNKGIEIGLDLVPFETADFKWDIYSAFTRNRNKVETLIDGVDRINVRNLFGGGITPVLEPGKSYGILRGSVPARDDEGNLLVNPTTGAYIESLEFDEIGDPNPDFTLGVTNTFSYKGIFFTGVLDYKHGGDIYSRSIESLLGRGVTKDTENREAPHILPGVYGDPNTFEPILDEAGNKIPNRTMITENNLWFNNTYAINTMDYFNVFDGTVIRLREVTLGYKLPASLLKNTLFGSASISITGRNLWYNAPNVPRYTNFDPEINGFGSTNTQGIEYTTAPSSKRYGVNLRFTF